MLIYNDNQISQPNLNNEKLAETKQISVILNKT